jgi:hypothetical protein
MELALLRDRYQLSRPIRSMQLRWSFLFALTCRLARQGRFATIPSLQEGMGPLLEQDGVHVSERFSSTTMMTPRSPDINFQLCHLTLNRHTGGYDGECGAGASHDYNSLGLQNTNLSNVCLQLETGGWVQGWSA